MFRAVAVILLAFLIFPGLVHSEDADIPTLEVQVVGIKDLEGEIGVALWNSRLGYPTDLEHAYIPEWVPLEKGQNSVTVVFDTMPPGEYAVSVVHDTIANRKVDRSRLGFPKEGVGFSNDQKVTMRAPRYQKSKFPLAAGEHKKIVVELDYRD